MLMPSFDFVSREIQKPSFNLLEYIAKQSMTQANPHSETESSTSQSRTFRIPTTKPLIDIPLCTRTLVEAGIRKHDSIHALGANPANAKSPCNPPGFRRNSPLAHLAEKSFCSRANANAAPISSLQASPAQAVALCAIRNSHCRDSAKEAIEVANEFRCGSTTQYPHKPYTYCTYIALAIYEIFWGASRPNVALVSVLGGAEAPQMIGESAPKHSL